MVKDNLRGSILMVASMAGFALEDVLIKQMASALPMGQVLALIGCGGTVIFGTLALVNGKRVLSRAALTRVIVLRNLGEVIGSVTFVAALVLTTLSSASAILQASPLAVTLGAALFLGEPVGWRRWTAVGIGFVGVLLIIRPGLAGFTPASLLAVVAVAALAMRDLCSRAVPAEVASVQLAAWAFMSIVPGGIAVMLVLDTPPVVPSMSDMARFGAVIVIGGLAYYALVGATRIGEVSAVVPFRYTRLVFALILGNLVFGERPDTLMLTGAALIVVTGVYTIWRDTRARATRSVERPTDRRGLRATPGSRPPRVQ